MIVVFDTETTGFPNKNRPLDHPDQPHIVQLAASLQSAPGREIAVLNAIIRPGGWEIPEATTKIHGISTERAMDEGIPIDRALELFFAMYGGADVRIAHNLKFDDAMMDIDTYRTFGSLCFSCSPGYCTMTKATPIVNLPPTPKMVAAGFNKPKSASLTECIKFFFNEDLSGAHDAMVDVRACSRVYWELIARGVT